MLMLVIARAIKPKRMNISQMKKAAFDALAEEGRAIEADFKQTTATWSGARPSFKPKLRLSSSKPSVQVGPTGSGEGVKKWTILNGGARAHTIRARAGKRLRFRTGGKAKTSPGSLKSGSGRAGSGPARYAKQIRHPGIKARGWALIAAANSRNRAFSTFQTRLEQAAQRLYG